MNWLTLALISIGIGTLVALFDKYTLSRTTARAYLFLIGVVNGLTLLLVPLGFIGSPSTTEWSVGIILGLVFATIAYSTFRAFQQEEVSRLVPLGILSTIFISISSVVFFDEQLTTLQYLSFVLFLIGAILLATRIVIKVELLDDIQHFRIEKFSRRVRRQAENAWTHPFDTALGAGTQLSNQFFWTVYDILDAPKNWESPNVAYLHYKRKLKLIRGLRWYLFAIALTVPYILFARELNAAAGVGTGFVSIRAGLFIGAMLYSIGHWREIRNFIRKRRLFAAAGLKEVVSAGSGFLWWAAATSGPLSIVHALGSLQSAGVFIIGTALSYFGVLHESLKRRDIIQKAVGVLCVAGATALLFIG